MAANPKEEKSWQSDGPFIAAFYKLFELTVKKGYRGDKAGDSWRFIHFKKEGPKATVLSWMLFVHEHIIDIEKIYTDADLWDTNLHRFLLYNPDEPTSGFVAELENKNMTVVDFQGVVETKINPFFWKLRIDNGTDPWEILKQSNTWVEALFELNPNTKNGS